MIERLIERFTRVSIVGLDVGSTRIKAAELVRSNGSLFLRRAAVESIGEEGAAVAMTRLIAAAGFKATHAVLGLASPEVIVQPFSFARLPKKELAGAIRIEAEHAILNGHQPDAMAVDWYLFNPQSRESMRGLLAVVPKETLAAETRVVHTAGLVPAIVDVKGLALWNAYWTLSGSRNAEPKTTLLINVDAHSTNLTIAKGASELILVRDLHVGAQSPGGIQAGEWVSELRDSLAYARSKSGLRALDAAYVTGGGMSPEILPLLRSVLSVPVEPWDPLDQLVREEGSPAVDPTLGPSLAVAIGLALRSLA